MASRDWIRAAILRPEIRLLMKNSIPFWRSIGFAAWTALAPLSLSAREAPANDLGAQLSKIFASPDADKAIENEGVRYLPGAGQSVIQTPCYRFVDPEGRRLELTGAVHIADKAYYDGLNKHLEGFDAVLFELVADPAQVEKLRHLAPGEKVDGGKESTLGKLYRVMAHDLLGLSLQMESIDYRCPNFVHADLSDKDLEALLKERGLNLDDLISGKLKEAGINLEQATALLPLLKIFVPKDDPKALERMMAPMMARLESPDGDATSALFNEIIVLRRNAKALEVLDQQVAAGKRNLAIFYGSAHFHDLREKLVAKGWKQEGMEWRSAWVVPAKVAEAVAPSVEPALAAAKVGEVVPADPAATALIAEAFRPLATASACRFTATTAVKAEVLGQKQDQEASVSVQAMRPNLLVLHAKGSEGASGSLVSDGATVTIHVDGAKTYKQLPAPAKFADFAKLPDLASIGLDGLCDVFPFLTMDPSALTDSTGIKGTKVLDQADLDGKPHGRVEALLEGNRVVLWIDKQARFPLTKVEIDASKLLDEQLAQLGPQAAALKNMVKIEAAMKFSEGDTADGFATGTFQFVPPPDTKKE